MKRQSERGWFAVAMLLLLFVVIAAAGVLTHLAGLLQHSAAREQASAQALCLAESGVEVALARLAGDGGYRGEEGTPLGSGRFSVAVRSRQPLEIEATGEAPYAGVLTLRRTLRVRGALAGGVFRRSEWHELPPAR